MKEGEKKLEIDPQFVADLSETTSRAAASWAVIERGNKVGQMLTERRVPKFIIRNNTRIL